VRRFPGPDELAELMGRQGFVDVSYRGLGGGIVALHTGTA
jgi:ubiquinone/menaquinone biosynthesis C-methylase UbiE